MSPCGLVPFYVNASASWMPFNWGSNGEYCYRLNHSAPALPTNPAHNTTDPILCVCQDYLQCGCDNTEGPYNIPSTVRYAIINGTEYAIVNGTLENGTTVPAESSGTSIEIGLAASATWVLLTLGAAFFIHAI